MNSISGREAFRSLQEPSELLLLPVGPSVINPGLTCDDLCCSNNWTESRVVREEGFSPVPYWLTFLKRRATTNFNTFIKSKNELLFTLLQEKIREQKYDKNMDADSLRADHEPVGQQSLFRTPMVHC